MMKKIEQFIEKNHMIENGDRIIAGISGGADSVCLLFVLLELRKKYAVEIIAVHVNHQIRGEDALSDEQFTVDLCKKHDVKCIVFRKDVELIAKNRKQSVEEAGRDVRREAFFQVLKENEGTKIAMAHHQNDNAETFLMNISRGTGLKGLGGIRPVNGKIIRPLLCMTRTQIEEFVRSKKCGWCTDETNNEQDYTRNKIRHLILPVLEQQINVHAIQHMNETMEKLCDVWEYLQAQTQEAIVLCVKQTEKGELQIDKENYDSLHKVIQSMVIKKCLSDIAGAQKDLTSVHIEAIEQLMEKQCGKSRNLPYGVEAIRNYKGILLRQRKCNKEEEMKDEIEEIKLNIPGKTHIPHKNLMIECLIRKADEIIMEEIPQKPYTKWFDYDIIKGNLTVRSRQAGDYIVIDKKGKKQKIKSYFVNEKIPAEQRNLIPLICDGEKVIWIVGYRMSSACQVVKTTKNVLEITVMEEKENVRKD